MLRWRSHPAGGPARPAGVMALLPGRHVPDAEVAYRLASPVVLAVINALFRMRTSGSLPAAGPVLLAPNHVSFVDPLVLAVAAWRQGRALRFLVVRGAMQHPVTGWVITASRQIPVEPQGTGGRALSAAEEALRRGDVVCVYPQGGVVEGGGARRVRTGVARLARASGVPVTPAATVGCERVRPWWRALRRRPAEVLFGAPVAARSEEGDHAFAQRVIHEISTLAGTAIGDRGSRRDHLAN